MNKSQRARLRAISETAQAARRGLFRAASRGAEPRPTPVQLNATLDQFDAIRLNAVQLLRDEWPGDGGTEAHLPREFVDYCEDRGTTAADVIGKFVRDLCALDGCGGADQRDAVQDWFHSRCSRGDWTGD